MSRRTTLIVLLLLALLALSGCGGKKPAATAQSKDQPAAQVSTPKPSNAAPIERSTVKPAAAEAAAQPSTAADEDGSLSLVSRDAGLDALKSYRMTWKSEWKGTDSSGEDQTGSWDWTEEFESQPAALHFVWKGQDSSEQSASTGLEMYQMGDITYMLSPESDGTVNCISMSSADQSGRLTKGIFSPASLGSISDAKYLNSETVNGIPTKHYKYGEGTQAVLALGKTAGEIWIAQDGGFVVKDVLKWDGGGGLFGMDAQSQGQGSWTWELTDINQPIGIQAPENCGGGATDLPMLDDASEKSTFGDMVTYKTAAEIADVVAFYQQGMAAAGWEEAEDEAMITAEMATLSFANDTDSASLLVTAGEDGTTVMLSVSKK